ncbi:excisionase family DNA-binding protein [Mycolicibacterium sp. XJ662]
MSVTNIKRTVPPVDIRTAARILNVSTMFIRRRIDDGTLPAYQIKGSRVIRIERADVEALKQQIAVRPGGAR